MQVWTRIIKTDRLAVLCCAGKGGRRSSSEEASVQRLKRQLTKRFEGQEVMITHTTCTCKPCPEILQGRRQQTSLLMPVIVFQARAQSPLNPPPHPPTAMHDDDHDHPALHSTFDPALFDQLVNACVKRVPRGRVTTYGK